MTPCEHRNAHGYTLPKATSLPLLLLRQSARNVPRQLQSHSTKLDRKSQYGNEVQPHYALGGAASALPAGGVEAEASRRLKAVQTE